MLISLEDHNRNKYREWDLSQQSKTGRRPNGIACPKCSEELDDVDTNVSLASYPPKKSIACKCGYNGWRIA